MKFSFIKRINTTKNSIFYSLIKYNNEIIAFGRRHYGPERVIKKITLDDNFDIIEDNNITFRGENMNIINTCEIFYISISGQPSFFILNF